MTKANKVQMFFGAEEIVEAYERTLAAKATDTVCLSGNYETVIGDYFEKEYTVKLNKQGVRTREILPDTPGNRSYVEGKDKSKRQVKFMKIERASESDYILYDDKVLLVSYDAKLPWAMEVTDENVVRNLRCQFEELWGRL